MTVEDILVCPKCKMPLAQAGGSFVCGQRHTYDISKHGYVNLVNTSSQKESGDSKEMSRARTSFLSGGAYGQFRDALCRAAGKGDTLVDAGCGEGYYTCAAAEGFSLTVGFDLSKASVDHAARRAKACGLESKVKFAVDVCTFCILAGKRVLCSVFIEGAQYQRYAHGTSVTADFNRILSRI